MRSLLATPRCSAFPSVSYGINQSPRERVVDALLLWPRYSAGAVTPVVDAGWGVRECFAEDITTTMHSRVKKAEV